MNIVDGHTIRSRQKHDFEVVIVGSGPAGAATARTLARAGAKVAVVEAGLYHPPASFSADSFAAMTSMYHRFGAALTLSLVPMPVVQGRAVGGTSVINGAISWRLPQDVYEDWVESDPPLCDAIPWQTISSALDEVEERLNIHPTDPSIAGPNNLLLGTGAEAMGLEHRPISRNVKECEGLGRCLQGCPAAHKLSMDRTYLPDAVDAGATIFAGVEVKSILARRGRATGVRGRALGGGKVDFMADKVVVAAGAVHSPALILRSRLRGGPTGQNFMCHPGVSMAGFFKEPLRMWTGATQGHEVVGLRREGIKFEALGYDYTLTAARLKGAGREYARKIATLTNWANWGAAIKATSRGKVSPSGRVRFSLNSEDMVKVRRSISVLGQMMLAAGAEYVIPGVHGWDEKVEDAARMAEFANKGSIKQKHYTMVATHLFGTARMGSNPRKSVVGFDFQHHRTKNLYVVDSSVFPSNTGVNPQTSIIALATIAARAIAQNSDDTLAPPEPEPAGEQNLSTSEPSSTTNSEQAPSSL